MQTSLKRLLVQKTFIAIKPDGVQRGLIGRVISRFEDKGFKLVGIKMVNADKKLLEQHYINIAKKPFYSETVNYMASGPICAMAWEGPEILEQSRKMLGNTNPGLSLPGTIRGDFASDVSRNICHGSDQESTAERELNLWFKNDEIVIWDSSISQWCFDDKAFRKKGGYEQAAKLHNL